MRYALWIALLAIVAGCDSAKVIRVSSEPPNAEVLFNGQLVGKTPHSKEIKFGDAASAGTYVSIEGEVRKSGWLAQRFSATDKQPKYEYHLKLVQDARTFSIESTPPGAEVELGGRPAGKTPWNDAVEFPWDPTTGDFLPVQVRLSRRGFREAALQLDWSGSTRLDAKLAQVPRTVTLRSDPIGARVLLDGQEVGRTPYQAEHEFPVDPRTGDFRPLPLTLEKRGYATQTVGLDAEDANSAVTLVPLPKSWKLVTTPPGADILQGQTKVGTTPVSLELVFPLDPNTSEITSVKLSVQKLGFRTEEVVLEYEDPASKAIALQEVPKAISLEVTPGGAQVSFDGVPVGDAADPEGNGVGRLTRDVVFKVDGAGNLLPIEVSITKERYKPGATRIAYASSGPYKVTLEEEPFTTTPYWEYSVESVSGKMQVKVKSSTVRSQWDTSERKGAKSTLVNLTETLGGKLFVRSPALSADGQSLVFEVHEKRQDKQCSNLRMLTIASPKGITTITNGYTLDFNPSWAQDGNIYYCSDRKGNGFAIYRQKPGAPALTTVLDSQESNLGVQAAPSGDQLVFERWTGFAKDRATIFRSTTTGGLATQLLEGECPRWSPQGDWIAYCGFDPSSGKRKIFVMRPDGTGLQQLTSDPESEDLHPSWSPDGSRIVFASDRGRDEIVGERNFDIYMIRLDGTDERRLTVNASWDDWPIFDKKGNIIFRSNRGGGWNLWRMDVAE